MSTSASSLCPRCGASLDDSSIDGLCARCLGALNFAPDTVLPGEPGEESAPLFTPAEVAKHFPQLEVLEILGRGGMGVVYKARQKSLGRLVALKLLAPERIADPKFADRFAHEAKALAALSHPNIVTIHDFGQVGGFYYLLMEFVDGVNLRQAMAASRFTPEQALAIVPPVCEALQYAHEHGIVHRDIKPENLLLDKTGRVKIADFGIAKMVGTESSGAGLWESQPAGTPQYMAPEQKEHRATDHRADIYSLGVVLYEMLTGELPAEKLQPPSRRVQVDIRIDEIVLCALEKTPELRFQTAANFRTRVEHVNGEKTVAQTAATNSMPGSRFGLFELRHGRRVIVWRSVLAATLAVFAIALVVGSGSSLVAEGANPLLVVVALAGVAAFLTVVTSARISFRSGASPHSEPENNTGPPRFSREAIVGACWVPVPFLSFFAAGLVIYQGRSGPSAEPEWWQLAILIPALIMGVAAPFGTTILGWVAVAQIRRSAGRIHGLQLALFDGLLFPLMTLSAVIAVAGVAMAKMFVDFYANPSVVGDLHIHPPLVTRVANWLSLNKEVAVIVGVVAAIVVNVLIVRAVLSAVRREVTSAPPENSATGNEIKAASIAIIFALIATALGALAAIRNGGVWPAMAFSLLFAGMSIIMALPVRRLGVGKCALIVAALGTGIWPLVGVVVSHSRTLPAAFANDSFPTGEHVGNGTSREDGSAERPRNVPTTTHEEPESVTNDLVTSRLELAWQSLFTIPGAHRLNENVTLTIETPDPRSGMPPQRGYRIGWRDARASYPPRVYSQLARGDEPFVAYWDESEKSLWLGSPSAIIWHRVAFEGDDVHERYQDAKELPPDIADRIPAAFREAISKWYPDPEKLAEQIAETVPAVTSGFGPVIERIIHHPADSPNDYGLDLDSGNFVKSPDSVFDLLRTRFDGVTKFGRRDETINRWARDTGADLTVGFTSPDVTLSLYGGAICYPTLSFEEAKAGDVMKAANDAAQERKKGGETLPPLTMFHRLEVDREGAFVFQTREGGIGLLQIVDSAEEPRSVKIRYKLLVAEASAASAARTDSYTQADKGAAKETEKASAVIRTATKPGSYDIKPGLKLVITQDGTKEQPASERSVVAELIWHAPDELKPSATYDIPVSDGLPYVIAWREDGAVLWVNCGSMGRGSDKEIVRYLRTLTIRGPGEIDEGNAETGRTDDENFEAHRSVPDEVRRAFESPPPPPPRPPMKDSDEQRNEEASTGTLSGRFVYDGEPPVAKDLFPSFAEINIDKPQERGPDGRFSGVEAVYREYLKHKIRPPTIDQSLRVGKDKGLADVVLWVVSEDIPWTPSPENQSPVTIQIKNASFLPRATAVIAGQSVIIENQDPVDQSVSAMFSRTLSSPFNVLLKASSTESSTKLVFPVPEPFPAKISLQHCPWASGLLFVHSNPYVAISQEDGSFRIPNLPLGDWEFQAWHPRSGYIMDWPRLRGPRKKGRFTQKITAGDNRLAAIELSPELFKVRPGVDKTSLLGQWQVISKTTGGEPADKFNFDGMRWTLGEGTLDILPATINRSGATEKPMPKSSYSVDNTQAPAHFNWTFGEGTMSVVIPAIYELKDDVLRVCVSQHGEPRPSSFETKGQMWTVYEFKRVPQE